MVSFQRFNPRRVGSAWNLNAVQPAKIAGATANLALRQPLVEATAHRPRNELVSANSA